MSLAKSWNSGGSSLVRGAGVPALRDILNGITGMADITAVKALDQSETFDGQLVVVTAAGQQLSYKYVAASTLTGDDLLVLTPADARTAGRWVLAEEYFDLKLAIAFGTADAAVLYTVPAGFILNVSVPWWEVTVSWAGGASSAIGLSSVNAGLATKGDLLGGASGDLAATLVSTGALAKGTVGAKIGKPGAVLVATDTIRFDRITSAFTSGTGFAHVPVFLVATP